MRTYQYYITFLIIIPLISVSCASYRAVHPAPVNIQSVIEPGDKVKIVTIDDQEVDFEVIEVTEEYLIGENIKVPLKDITGIKEENRSAGMNALLITIITLSVAGAALIGASSIPYGSTPSTEAISDTLMSTTGGAAELMLTSISSSSFHLGDWYAFEHGRIDEKLCIDECRAKHKCEQVTNIDNAMQQYYNRHPFDNRPGALKPGDITCPSLKVCKLSCIQKQHPIGIMARHVQGGFFSDGSYYSGYYFKNTHPTKDKYEKTKWQKDRDGCMELASESVELNFWNTAANDIPKVKVFKKQISHYRKCLNERGYSITLY